MFATVDSSEITEPFSNKVIFSCEFVGLLDKNALHAFQKDFLSLETSILAKKDFFSFLLRATTRLRCRL